MSPKFLPRRMILNIASGRHLESYAIFLIGIILVILGLIGVISNTILQSAILLALAFLVFHTTIEVTNRKPSLDQVLRNRNDFGPFGKLLPGIRDLRVYGPTAINVLINSADIRRLVLDVGGIVRVIVLSGNAEALKATGI